MRLIVEDHPQPCSDEDGRNDRHSEGEGPSANQKDPNHPVGDEAETKADESGAPPTAEQWIGEREQRATERRRAPVRPQNAPEADAVFRECERPARRGVENGRERYAERTEKAEAKPECPPRLEGAASARANWTEVWVLVRHEILIAG